LRFDAEEIVAESICIDEIDESLIMGKKRSVVI